MIKCFILFLYMFFYKVSAIKISGDYKNETICNYLWISTYVDCMSFLNNKNKKINDCLTIYNLPIRHDYTFQDNMLNGFIKCNNKKYDVKINKTQKYENDYNMFLNISNCINNINNLTIMNENITCDFKIYQI